MFVVNTYTVMDALVVELTCWHGAGSAESHLVYREQVSSDWGPVDALAQVAEVLQRAAREAEHGELELTDDCLA